MIGSLIYIVVVFGLILTWLGNWSYDDPYITYRYAQNLSHGLGFVYNSGERVLSTTTPLFAMLLAVGNFFWQDLLQLAVWIGAFSLGIGGLFLWDMGRSWKMPLLGWTGVLLYPTFPLLVGTLSSETPLYIALCLGAFAFYFRRKWTLTAIFAALAVLTRADGILVPFLLGIDFISRECFLSNPRESQASWIGFVGRRVREDRLWMAMGLFIGLLLAWAIFGWIYFGSPLPVTLFVKQHQAAIPGSQRFLPGVVTILRPYFKNWFYNLEFLVGLLGVVSILVGYWRLRLGKTSTEVSWFQPAAALVPLWMVFYFTAYSLLGVTRYFWYYAPLTPGFVVLVGIGVTAVQALFPGKFTRGFVVLLLATFSITQLWSLNLRSQNPDHRMNLYQQVGNWLYENTPASASVGALEVGAIGYYSNRYMVDYAGLIQPEVAAQMTGQATYQDTTFWAITQYKPDYVISYAEVFPQVEVFLQQNCIWVRSFDSSKLKIGLYDCR